MSKKKQAMELFKEYGTETMNRIHKILELEKPVIIDFSNVEDEFSAYGDVYYDWVEGTLDFIREAAKERKVYIFMDGEAEISCRVSKCDVDPKTRDWSLEDELFDYCVGSLSQYIDLNKGFGEQQFVDFIESWYALKDGESIDDWDENDEVWDYVIQTFSEGIQSMKKELDMTISNMDSVIKFIEFNKNRLWDSCEVWVTE